MKQSREVTTCVRCRSSKRLCDKSKPSCTRCTRGGVQCSYEKDYPDVKDDVTAHGSSGISYPSPVTTPSTPAPKAKKRNRACLSCTRCHRLKVKCDQKQPCLRCSRSGFETICIYKHKSRPPQQPDQAAIDQPHEEVPFALTGEDPNFVVATWFLRKRGSTHYRSILNRVRSLLFPTCTPTLALLKYRSTDDSRWNLSQA